MKNIAYALTTIVLCTILQGCGGGLYAMGQSFNPDHNKNYVCRSLVEINQNSLVFDGGITFDYDPTYQLGVKYLIDVNSSGQYYLPKYHSICFSDK